MAEVFAVGLRALMDNTTITKDFGSGPAGLLSLLCVVCTSLSIVGVVLAFITYSLFSDLRTLSGGSLLNLFAALFLLHLVSVVGVEQWTSYELCITTAFLLHFLWLAVNFWLASMTRDLFITFRDNLNLQPSPAEEARKSLLKNAAFAWLIPLGLTMLALYLHFKSSVDELPLLYPTCWLIGRGTLLYTLALPSAGLGLSNLRYFIRTAAVIRYTASQQVNRRLRDKMRRQRTLQLFLFAKLQLLFASTWSAGVLAQVLQIHAFWFVYGLLFALQGFFVSLSYSCNSRVFRLYSKSLRPSKTKSLYGAADVSRSTSLTLLTWSNPEPEVV